MTDNRFRLVGLAALSTLSINSAMALPIDWSGVFGVDSTILSNMRRTTDKVEKDPANKSGTQGIQKGDNGASFQTYIFKLNPQIIVNDGVTLKGELSSGYLRGGFAGDNSTTTENGSGNNSYFYASSAQRSALNVNQMYMELYADTALVKIGRMSKHYGLGVVWDNGSDPWDRFFSMYDGIEANMTIGNFSLIPYYAKISSYNNGKNGGAGGSEPSGQHDVRELGLTAEYNNKNRDFIVSVLYAKRSSERRSSFYTTNTDDSATAIERGKTSVTVIEPYISKKWNKFRLQAEASMQSGDYGNVYGSGERDSKLSANAYILDAKYDLNPKWDLGILAGQISGDRGNSNKFEALYLHPNYHIAELMFRYYYPGFTEGGRSIFDSSITNSQFWKLAANYKTDKWVWKGAMVMAKAMETAKANRRAYHHEESYAFDSTEKQNNDMGYEFDFGFDYRWNPNVLISGSYGYWFVGDYFEFSNSADKIDIANVHGGSIRATLEF